MLFTTDNHQLKRIKPNELPDQGFYIRTTYQKLYSSNKAVINNPIVHYTVEQSRFVKPEVIEQIKAGQMQKQKGEHPVGAIFIYQQYKDGQLLSEHVGYSFLNPKDKWNKRTAVSNAASKAIQNGLSDFIDRTTMINTISEHYYG